MDLAGLHTNLAQGLQEGASEVVLTEREAEGLLGLLKEVMDEEDSVVETQKHFGEHIRAITRKRPDGFPVCLALGNHTLVSLTRSEAAGLGKALQHAVSVDSLVSCEITTGAAPVILAGHPPMRPDQEALAGRLSIIANNLQHCLGSLETGHQAVREVVLARDMLLTEARHLVNPQT